MIKIKTVLKDGTIVPKDDFPSDTVRVVCNGIEYLCYQDSDELPVDEAQEGP